MPDDLSAYLDPAPRARRGNYDDIIQKHAQRTGLDPELVKAVVHQESGSNPRAVSPKGAQGVGQLMPATAKRFGVTDPFDAEQNIRGATDYLKFLNDRFKGNRDLVLAGYNAGEGAVDKFKGVPPYKETQNYVKSINARLGQQKPTGDLDAYLDPKPSEQIQPPSPRIQAGNTRPRTGQQSAPKTIEEALSNIAESTNQATEKLKRRAARQSTPSEPPISDTVTNILKPVPERSLTFAEDRAQRVAAKEAARVSGMGGLHRIDDPEVARVQRAQRAELERNPILSIVQEGRLSSAQAQRAAERASTERATELQRQQAEPEIQKLAEAYRADIRKQGLPQWLTETLSRGGAGVGEFGVGVGRLFAPLSRDPETANQRLDELQKHVEAMTRAAVAEGADRNVVSRTIQDATAGFIASTPEFAGVLAGAPAIGTFGAGGGIRGIGRGEDTEGVMKSTAHGLATGAAFEAPIPSQVQRSLSRAVTKGAAVGGTTAAIDLASGATPQQAIASGLTNAAFAGVGELGRSRAGLKERMSQRATQTEVQPPVEAQRETVEPARSAGPVQGTPARDLADTGTETVSVPAESSGSAGPQKFYHRDFGEVAESPNQRRVGKGRVRVVAEDGSEHVIKRAAMTGAGNQRAVPVKSEPVQPSELEQLRALLKPESDVQELGAVDSAPKPVSEPQLSDRPDGGFQVKSDQGSLIVRPIVDQNGRPTGNFETFDVFVEPEFRRQGVATKLYAEAQREAAQRGGKLLSSTEQTEAGQALNTGLRKAKEVPRQEIPDLQPTPKGRNRAERTAYGQSTKASLSQFVRRSGGITPSEMYRGETDRLRSKEMGGTGAFLVGSRQQGNVKQTADIVMQMANDAGYRDPQTGRPFENPGDFLRAVEGDASGTQKIYVRSGAEDFSAAEAEYYAEQEAQSRAAEARDTFLESGRGADLFDKIADRKATDAEREEYIQLAEQAGISRAESDDLIADARAEIESLQGDGRERAQSPTRGTDQLGFVQEGLTQESAPPPKRPDQRAQLLREEQDRQAALNPERTAAQAKLEEIRRRGMTVEDYARQPDLYGNAPDPKELRLLREIERGPVEEPSRQPRLGEAGAIDVDLLTLGVRPFAKEVAEKGRIGIQGVKEISDGIRSILAPATRGPSARTTAAITRANASEMARAHDIAEKSLEGARNYFSKQKPDVNYDFIDRMERGQTQPDPKTQKFADTLRDLLDERRDQIRALGTGKLEHFIENYFPHIWKDPTKAKTFFGQGRRPLEGPKSFLKERTIPFTKDGLSYGLEPVSNNPIDLAVLRLREMDKYLMAHKTMTEMKENGLLQFIKSSERVPEGYKKIDDRVATVFGGRDAAPQGGQLIRGYYVAPEPAAKILNNYLSPGLEGTALRTPYRAWRATANLMNQAQLGFSFFHGGFTTLDAMVSRTAAGLEDIFRHGKPLRGIKTLASTPLSPLTNLAQGSKLLSEWYKPGSQGAEIAKLADAMQEAGGRARMDRFYTNDAATKFKDVLKQGNLIGAALRLPSAAIEKATAPVMEWLVPRQKAGIFAEMAKRELERLGPTASREQTRQALAKAWDSVDNRMGQMVYDNIFWNKVTKDLAMASVRSVGWNLGTAREVAGGIADFATLPKRALTKGRTDPLFTHKMAYATALPLVVGTMGAMTQYLLTGSGPQELKDYFFPKTGLKDENGNDERIAFPSYMKDVFHFKEEPTKVVGSKLHPLISVIGEMLGNRDYYGTKIRNEDDPYVQQVKDVAKHLSKSFVPFSVRGFQKEAERDAPLHRKLLPFIGITPAPSYINQTPAEKMMSKLTEERMPAGTRTKEEAERGQLRHRLQTLIRKGQNVDQQIQEGVDSGILRPNDAKGIQRDAKQLPVELRFKRLGAKDAINVYRIMSSTERAFVRDELEQKYRLIDNLPVDEQEKLRSQYAEMGIGQPSGGRQRPERPSRAARPARAARQ